MADATVTFMKKVGHKALLFKVDFEKAFDCANWKFVEDLMLQMGLEIDGANRSTPAFHQLPSILINGSSTGEFNLKRGVRQGDPLSPFLFLIAMEGMHIVMEEAKTKGLLEGVKLG